MLLVQLAMSEISLFGCIICCKALALLFSIELDVLDSGVPYLSSNVPFTVHDFK
jgi:hypothetical protein